MRPIKTIYRDLRIEQKILCGMSMNDYQALLMQSKVVDKLVVEYHKALNGVAWIDDQMGGGESGQAVLLRAEAS